MGLRLAVGVAVGLALGCGLALAVGVAIGLLLTVGMGLAVGVAFGLLLAVGMGLATGDGPIRLKEGLEMKVAFDEAQRVFSLSDGPKQPLDGPSTRIKYGPSSGTKMNRPRVV
jgi:hypothetical protein